MSVSGIPGKIWNWIKKSYKESLINLWCIYLVYGLVTNLSCQCSFCLDVYSHIMLDKFNYIVPNLAMCFLVLGVALGLCRIHSGFRWSLLGGNNIGLLPLQKKYFGPIFLLLLILNMPTITFWEETTFRLGLKGWIDGTLWSIVFGLCHSLIGVPIGFGIAMIILGLWLTWCYLGADPVLSIYYSTLNHTSYNLIGCMIIGVHLLYSYLKTPKSNQN